MEIFGGAGIMGRRHQVDLPVLAHRIDETADFERGGVVATGFKHTHHVVVGGVGPRVGDGGQVLHLEQEGPGNDDLDLFGRNREFDVGRLVGKHRSVYPAEPTGTPWPASEFLCARNLTLPPNSPICSPSHDGLNVFRRSHTWGSDIPGG